MSDQEAYILSLHATNEELEMEIQLAMEERELLEKRIKTLEDKLAVSRKNYVTTRRIGDKLHAFIDELICADLLHDEVLDKANDVSQKWEDNR